MSNYVYYPDLNNIDFYKKIFVKKEFKKNNSKNTKVNEFSLLPQQLFLKNYININTPYNSILIYHGTGVGKTCSAISIAEGFKKVLKNKKIIVLLSRNIKDNFIKELYNIEKPDNRQCVGKVYKYKDDLKFEKKEKKVLQIKKNIRKHYKFYGYTQFANKVMKLTGWDGTPKKITNEIKSILKKNYSNTVFIIDEVHHIKTLSDSDSEIKKIPPILEAILEYSENIKLVMMSATPMYDTPREIVFLLNLMLLNDNRPKLIETEIFDKSNNLTKNGEEILKKNLVGYISYFRGENPETFPYRFYSEKSIIPKTKYDMYGKINDDNLKYLKIYPCYFSKEHYDYYLKIQNDGIKKNTKQFTILSLQQIANIVFKTSTGNFVHGKNGFKTSDNGQGSFYTVTKKINKKLYKYYRYQKHSLIDKDKPSETGILNLKHLNNYSPKIFNIIDNIIHSSGLVFVYSEYIESGTLPVALALEQAGYERLVISNENQLLDYTKNSKGGGGKNTPRCYKCGNHINHPNHRESNKNYHKFKVGKYAILSGDFADIKDITNHIQLFNSTKNLNGEELRIIIGTVRLSEGIDLHNIRHVHIMEPWWNLSRIEQIIGRAVRHKSHVNLPSEERNVEIYNYSTISPNNDRDTIDLYKYKEAETKDIRIKNIEYLLKQSSVDCNVFKYNNVRISDENTKQITTRGKIIHTNIGDQPYSRECCYKKECNYSCAWESSSSDSNINRSTNSFNYTNSLSIKLKKYIQDMYLESYIYTLHDIKKYIKNIDNIDDIYIYYVLNQYITDKITIYDKFKRKGYLIYKGDYYIFQPTDIENKKLPMYYRNLIVQKQNKFIRINNTNIDNTKNKNNVSVSSILEKIELLYNKYNQYITKYLVEKSELSNTIIINMIIDKQPVSVINMLKGVKGNKLLDIYFKNLKNKGLVNKNSKIQINKDLKENQLTGNLYGIFIRSETKDGVFKIINKTKKNDLTINKKISKRSKLTGRVCSTYDIYYLKQFYDKMNNNIFNIDFKIKKNIFCIYIEFLMRYNQIKDKKNVYFIYNN